MSDDGKECVKVLTANSERAAILIAEVLYPGMWWSFSEPSGKHFAIVSGTSWPRIHDDGSRTPAKRLPVVETIWAENEEEAEKCLKLKTYIYRPKLIQMR